MANGKRSSLRIILVLVVILALASGGGAYAYFKQRTPGLTVQTEKVARRNLTEIVTATGKVQPFLQVKISPEVAGEIIELPVKEGQNVKKGDLLVRIKPDTYEAARKSAEATFRSAEADWTTARAEVAQAELELRRIKELFEKKISGEADYDAAKTARDVRTAQAAASQHRVDNAKAAVRRAEEDLMKCTIYSPIDGTIAKLNSEAGERVVGTGMMAGTEIMTVADLNEMEARVEVGEVDVPLVKLGQVAKLDVDSFRNRKFSGQVTQIANSAKTTLAGSQQEATKFEVRIRIADRERFLPGMSVTADIETRYRTNVLTVPIQSVTTRLPKGAKKPGEKVSDKEKEERREMQELGGLASKKKEKTEKPFDVVFVVAEGKAKMIPVQRGISDDAYYEITEGVTEGQEVVSGSYKAIARELEDDKVVKVDNKPKEAKPDAKK
ncbi:MAG TPA: efflux RND transporter periplasmic adaptor subunit [Verrucomicrobiota bacterium]|nr:efflux RND transporter periplasmic adaptor subunit [Verrucomicrobiales bacterium]HRI16056.1 efflux RND transporter periplasmic adaptor subunit [Verrucomicrobiota bacterium]